jgi:hypothetical protein
MVGDARSAGQVTGSCRESGAETSNHACRMNPAGRCACCSIAANWPVRSAGFHRVSVDAMHLTCGGGVTEVLTFLQQEGAHGKQRSRKQKRTTAPRVRLDRGLTPPGVAAQSDVAAAGS